MGMNLGNLLIAAFVGLFVVLALAGGISNFDTPAFANSLNASGIGTANALNTQVWSPLNQTTLGVNGSFNAQVQTFTGFAFVLPNFGAVINIMLNLPRIFILSFSTAIGAVPTPGSITGYVMPLFTSFLGTFVIIAGVDLWMKGDLLRVGDG